MVWRAAGHCPVAANKIPPTLIAFRFQDTVDKLLERLGHQHVHGKQGAAAASFRIFKKIRNALNALIFGCRACALCWLALTVFLKLEF